MKLALRNSFLKNNKICTEKRQRKKKERKKNLINPEIKPVGKR
jgi:hypothetical protein